jgi:hypothetical protein
VGGGGSSFDLLPGAAAGVGGGGSSFDLLPGAAAGVGGGGSSFDLIPGAAAGVGGGGSSFDLLPVVAADGRHGRGRPTASTWAAGAANGRGGHESYGAINRHGTFACPSCGGSSSGEAQGGMGADI